MFSLEEQIANYADVHFNAEHNAQFFFSTNAETEVTRQLNELAGVQNQIEIILREKVRANYTLFLDASEGIQNVGNDMISLKELIVKTQVLVENIRKNRFAPGNSKRSGNSLPKLGALSVRSAASLRAGGHNDNGAGDKDDKGDLSSVPAWVMRAPDDLSRYIIEQRFSQAATLAVKAKAFVTSVKDIIDLSPKSVMAEVVKKVEEREKLLASTILKSLSKLPNSPLWGAEEQQSRLKLLISLRQYDLAADGFVQCNTEVIPRTLRNVEASGETLEYIMEISRAFFVALTTACKTFLDLLQPPTETNAPPLVSPAPVRRRGTSFAATSPMLSSPNPISSPIVDPVSKDASQQQSVEDNQALKTMMNMLVHWSHLQMELFVAAFSRQVQVGSNDKANIVIEHFRMVCDNLGMTQHHASNVNTNSSNVSSPEQVDGSMLLSRGMSRSSVGNGQSGSGSETIRQNVSGPLTFVANCLHVAHNDAVGIMDSQLHMQGAASLSWLLLPDIRKWVHSFADEIVKEIYVQIRQEEWFPITDASLEIAVPSVDVSGGIAGTSSDHSLKQSPVALSYVWLVMILNSFVSESWILLNFSRVVASAADENAKLGNSSVSHRLSGLASASNSRTNSLLPVFGANKFSAVSESTSYSRADLSEIEPGMVSCIMRIVVNFIKNAEKVDVRSLTNAQRDCYADTLDRLADTLIPSVLHVISSSFYYEGLQTPPQEIGEMLIECLANLKAKKLKPDRQFSRPRAPAQGLSSALRCEDRNGLRTRTSPSQDE